MRSKHFLGIVLAGGGLVGAMAVGCGGGSATSTGTGGGTTTTHTTSKSSSSSSGTGGGTTTTGPSRCMDFSCATSIMVGSQASMATLADALTPDYYSFTGKKGDRIVIQTVAAGATNPPTDDGSVTDTVVTLYLPDKTTVWALNDDSWPRSSTDSTLWTELPMDGTYYFTVEDCNALAATNPNVSCAPADPGTDAQGNVWPGISVYDYSIFVGDATATKTEDVGSASATTTVTYTGVSGMTGSYYDATIDGDIAAQADKHTFTLTPPANIKSNVPGARFRAHFWVQPYGAGDGTGTALDIVATAKDMAGNILAVADQQYYTNGDDPNNGPLQLSFPLDDQFGNKLGSTYTLEIAASNKTAIKATQNFYIIDHAVNNDYYGQVEAEGPTGSAMNDAVAMAETLTVPSGVTGAYFIDGNLSSATDVDWFKMTIPGTAKTAFLDCGVARVGSGLTGFTAELFKDAAGSSTGIKIGPEAASPKVDLSGPTAGVGVTGGATLTLKISATGQDASNKGSYYHCTVVTQ